MCRVRRGWTGTLRPSGCRCGGPSRCGAAAVEILAGLERKHDIWVFPGTSGTKPIELRSAWKRIRARAGLQDVRLHDLRHTYASVGANAKMGLAIIGRLLGHSRVETTQRYAHLSDDPVREASKRIDSTIAAALDGKPPAEVVPLQSA